MSSKKFFKNFQKPIDKSFKICYNVYSKGKENRKMKKWTYEKEIKESTKILLTAYLTLMHSKTITATFTYNEKMYAYDLTENDINELVTATKDKLQINGLGKKRIEKIINNSIEIATTNEINEIKKLFPNYSKNNGYIAEFVYRMKVNGETENEIKSTNNSKPFDKASDTKDNKQIKNLDGKATFTSYEYLLTVCKRNGYNNIKDVENAIATLNRIYN